MVGDTESLRVPFVLLLNTYSLYLDIRTYLDPVRWRVEARQRSTMLSRCCMTETYTHVRMLSTSKCAIFATDVAHTGDY